MNLDAHLTAAQGAAYLKNVTAKTVGMWRSRGWIDSEGTRRRLTVVSRDKNGAARFPLREILTAERDTRRKPARSHRRVAA